VNEKPLLDKEKIDQAIATASLYAQPGAVVPFSPATIHELIDTMGTLAEAVGTLHDGYRDEQERRVLAENATTRAIHSTAEQLTAMAEDAHNGKPQNRARTIVVTRTAVPSPQAVEAARKAYADKAKPGTDPYYAYRGGYWQVQEDGRLVEGLALDEAVYAVITQMQEGEHKRMRMQSVAEIEHTARENGRHMGKREMEPFPPPVGDVVDAEFNENEGATFIDSVRQLIGDWLANGVRSAHHMLTPDDLVEASTALDERYPLRALGTPHWERVGYTANDARILVMLGRFYATATTLNHFIWSSPEVYLEREQGATQAMVYEQFMRGSDA